MLKVTWIWPNTGTRFNCVGFSCVGANLAVLVTPFLNFVKCCATPSEVFQQCWGVLGVFGFPTQNAGNQPCLFEALKTFKFTGYPGTQ